ncbi:hypothetical protein NL676_010494 [Syzygium grande]|nr:hypothetical protein NL676_010494 [Syzygium grande]
MLSIPPSLFQMDESGNGGIIVDSRTAITRLQTQAYNSLRDAFVKRTPHLKSIGGVVDPGFQIGTAQRRVDVRPPPRQP